MHLASWVGLIIGLIASMARGDNPPVVVRIPLSPSSEVDIPDLVARLGRASQLAIEPTGRPLTLPMTGLAAPLTRTLLSETLGPDATVEVQASEIVITLAPRLFKADAKPDWERRLRDLAKRADREADRRERFGMHARASYRPNDPRQPTVCLIHGLNSTSGVFKHFFEPLEAAGYGLVLYDFPYNRDLDETSAAFEQDWQAFRQAKGDKRPWSIVAHSMGSLLARSSVEGDQGNRPDVNSLILIAPPNHGSSLARAQKFLQTLQSVQALNGVKRTDPLALLGDGLGLAADDMMPGSLYLRKLNARPRRAGVRYHVLAGDLGYLSPEARRQISGRGVLGGVGRLMTAGVSESLDEITDGLGDGCVSVGSTRLEGVPDHRVLHANHLELIRAPLLFPEPGEVASMPDILRWLREDAKLELPRR